MNDADKTKEQLIRELEEARQRIAELEVAETEREGIKRFEDLLEDTENVLFTVANVIEVKDGYSDLHLIHMAQFSGRLALKIGLSASEQRVVRYGAILHDIGMVAVSDSILDKSSPLTSEEYRIIKQHTVLGDQLVRPMRFGDQVGPIVRGHHERWDGRGYPDGLEGESIPIGARIVSICDSFDAMTSRRPYRPALPDEVAIEQLHQSAGTDFDPHLVDVFSMHVDDIRTNEGIT